ncbi:CheC, inhibitor of MCP methylation [Candidatus Magnetobacterium bavaricum]|uniref:CheC, inhibitor of MCP methylation n=1 Tax=Candidatus Magnetobacterium bavaricum TaxID=29290 RepID=A0A0F3GLE4_9BACT|nr:CheC, inhibitor of MCP methylation [Candidatus Magnetobacterium bavaricum]
MILTPQINDSIREMINMGMGQAAGLLNEMFNTHITIKIPDINISLKHKLSSMAAQLWPESVSVVWFPFSGALEGASYILLRSGIASNLVDLLGGETTNDSVLDLIKIGALIEVGNIVLNGVIGTMVNILNVRLNYAVPDYHEAIASQLISENTLEPDSIVIMAKTCFEIKGHMINSDMLICLKSASFDAIVGYVNDMFEGYHEGR